MADVKARIIAVDEASRTIKKIDGAFVDMGESADEAGNKLDQKIRSLENLSVLGQQIQVLRGVGVAMREVYKVALDGAVLIGGDTLDAYEEFNRYLLESETNLKGLVTNALLPAIEGFNTYLETTENATSAQERQAIMTGLLTDESYDLGDSYVYVGQTLQKLIHDSASYDKALLVAAGILESDVSPALIAAQQDAIEARDAMRLLSEQIAGPLGASAKKFADEEARLADNAQEIRDEITKLGGLEFITPENQDAILKLRRELIGTVIEINDIEEAFGDAFDAGKTGRKVIEAKDRMEELREKAWEIEQQIIDLGSRPYTTKAQLEQIADLQEQLGEVEGAIGGLAAAQEDATKRMIFSMLQQQLAVDGLTTLEVERLSRLALEWGLIDQATYDAQQTVLETAEKISQDDKLNTWITNLGVSIGIFTKEQLVPAADIALALEDALQGASGDWSATFNLTVTGDQLPEIPPGAVGGQPGTTGASAAGNIDASTGSDRAVGGPVFAGLPYIVGEHGPEPFVPDQNGTIIPNEQIRGPTTVQLVLDDQIIGSIMLNRLGSRVKQANSAGAGITGY